MIIIDPETRQRIVCDKHSGDIEYELVGDPAITQEDLTYGDVEMPGGTKLERTQQQFGGVENQFFGTEQRITDNAKLNNLTERGNRKDTTVTKQRDKRVNVRAKNN